MDVIIKDMTIDDFGTCDYDDNNHLIGTGRVDEAEEFAPVRHGKWEIYDEYKQTIDGRTFDGWCECSHCKMMYRYEFSSFNYCPNCGTKMDGE